MVQHRKTRPCLTESLLMGRKESNQTKKILIKKFCKAYQQTTQTGLKFIVSSIASVLDYSLISVLGR